MGGVSKVKTNLRKVQITFFLAVTLWSLLAAAGLRAQTSTPRGAQNVLAHLPALEKKMGPHFRDRLSSGGATMFHLAQALSNSTLLKGMDSPQARAAFAKAAAKGARSQGQAGDFGASTPVPVNDASLDFQFSRLAGFTQSETSSAWCGNTIVAGYNDSGAFIRSVLEGVGGQSFTGVAVSQNRGNTFTGLPFLNPGSDPGTFLGGDPVVVCSDAQAFFYSSLYSHVTLDAQGNVLSAQTGVTVSHSSSSGLFWDSPITAVTKDANFHFLDKEWMAIDPTNPQNLYVTYTDFAATGTQPACQGEHHTPGFPLGPDIQIELVASKDGGNTWGPPVAIATACGIFLEQNLSGSQVAVGPRGEVYVAYSAIDMFGEGQNIQDVPKNAEIRVRGSLDGGATFAPSIIVAEATTASSFGYDFLESGFRTNAFPTLAVDVSKTASRGTLYLVWTDATKHQAPDAISTIFIGDPVYSFGDIVLSKSRDGGNTWSTPKIVSPTPANFQGAGRDQFMAGVAVDALGNLGVCYSDRRNDPHNLAIDHYCSLSGDHGGTFRDIRETTASWAPGHSEDFFINAVYMGDYDEVSSDATGVHTGFFSTFQVQTNTNPDVFGMRVK
jgi:hypothetical protein